MQLPAIYTTEVLLLFLMLSIRSVADIGRYNCSVNRNVGASIGVVVDRSTRVGKEQEIAMKIAVKALYRSSCIKPALYLRDSYLNSIATASKLIQDEKVQALVGTLPLSEASVLSLIHKNIPFLLTTPAATPHSLISAQSSNLIQFGNNLSIHMQCLAAIIGFFQWRRITVIYEQSYSFSLDSGIVTALSDQLKSVSVTLKQHLGFPPIFSMSDPETVIEEELRRLKNGSNRVFVVLHCSVELGTRLFLKANQMGMLENGFVWIVSDEVASLLDSFDSSVIGSMQGVIGYKTFFNDTRKSFKKFKIKFEQSYLAKYPGQGNPTPSIFALRAYDAMHAIAMTRNDLGDFKQNETKQEVQTNRTGPPKSLLPTLLKSNFEGLSGNVSFKNGKLQTSPTFQIINVVGKSYRELAFWTPELGFLKEPPGKTNHTKSHSHGRAIELDPVYWPGGQKEVPRGWTIGVSQEKRLKIGVPSAGAFHQFVNVSIDVAQNRTSVTGFSVEVFKASLQHLPYDLSFDLVPFNGTYDELVQEIYNKGFDGAIGDINILDARYKWADFTQPYVKSGMKMVVTQKEEKMKEMWMFMMVFERKMWAIIPSMGLFTGFVVWAIERRINPEFGDGTLFDQIGKVLWFSFTVLFFAHKESPRSNLSKLVLAPWYFLVAMLVIYFTAALTSQMTISQLQPSVTDVEILKRENAGVGCNWNSFICTYLVNVLGFKPKNIRHMRSIDDYPSAFQTGDIKAAFLITSHAQVFLAKYCMGYTLAGPTHTFGGLGFAFPKGSSLSVDISQAMLKATESGEIETLENHMLSYYNCSASGTNSSSTTSSAVGPKPFSGLFYICGSIASLALFFSLLPSILMWCRYLSTRFRDWVASIIIIIFSRTHQNRSTLRQNSNSSVTLTEVNCS